jgi:transcriptional regulator with XRE-family HTH domain
MTRRDVAELLQVAPRTVRNWEQAKARVPYSAYALLRIASGFELPGDAWRGWRIHGDALYSPEGLAFHAHEGAWWSLTCAMARSWQQAYAAGRLGSLQADQRAPARPGVMSRRHTAARGAPGPHLARAAGGVRHGLASAHRLSRLHLRPNGTAPMWHGSAMSARTAARHGTALRPGGLLRALRHFVWNPTVTMTPGRRARWACVQAAGRPVHMSTRRV